MYPKLNCRKFALSIILVQFAINGFAQVSGDFQTKNVSGNWSDFNAWNVYNGSGWVAATSGQLPTATTNVFVRDGQTISVPDGSAVCNDLNIANATSGRLTFSSSSGVLNVKGNFILTNAANCFGTWPAGAKIIFSGSGAQTFTKMSVNAVFVSIEVNKPSGSLTTSSNFRFSSFTLTSGNFVVGSTNEIQGTSPSSSITINGGFWTQNQSTTRLYSVGPSTIGPININSGSMILATSTGTTGLKLSTVNVTNGGTLTIESSAGLVNITTSLNVDATSTFNTALTTTPLPPSVSFNGKVNYNQAGPQNIPSATYSYLKLGGTGTKTLSGTVAIPANGTLEMSGNSPSPMLDLGGNTLNVSGTGTNLLYSSAALQTASSNEWNSNFRNLTINNSSGVSMSGLSRTIAGSLSLQNGTFNIGASGALTLDGASLVSTGGFLTGTSSSDFIVTGSAGGVVTLPLSSNISLHNITVSGTRTLAMDGSHNISLNGLFTIGSGACYDNGGESQITNSGGSIVINGRFINRDKDNFTGSNGAIPGIASTLNAGSTVEYALTGNQVVTARDDYQNITFSGSGTKTPSNSFTPTGTLYITGSAVLNASGHNIGDGSTITNFTMDGGRLILGTTGEQPQMGGTYNLTAGVVQFDGSSAQTIRSKSYQNIEVTGAGVSNSKGNITLNTNGAFTVKSGGVFEINDNNITGSDGTQIVTVETGGTFNCGNNQGFHGFTASLYNNSSIHANITNIQLQSGSIVSYTRTGDQVITTANNLVYQHLSIAGSGTKTAPSGNLTIQGNLTKSGTSTFTHNSGTVCLNGSSNQSFAGLTYNNLILTNSTKATNGTATIIDSIKINSATTLSIGASDTIILHSDAVKTARVGQVDGSINYNSSGKFLVERYIPAKLAWRFLSVALHSTQTIKAAWQENATTSADNLKPGYGTQITSNLSNWSTLGFDAYSSSSSSIKTYNSISNSYSGVASLFGTFDPTSGGYMTFIRGDRTATSLGSPVTSTILRTTGKLYTGNQAAFTVRSGLFTPVNNPYASPIDLRNLSRSFNLFYYNFDPNRSSYYGFGAFQTFAWNGLDYDVIPGGGSYGVINNVIESGQAFFVSTLGPDTSLQFTESAKTACTNSIQPFTPIGRPVSSIRANLYSIGADGNKYLADAALTYYADDYSNNIDGGDAKKFYGSGEALAIKTETKDLVVERRQAPRLNENILYSISGLITRRYQFEIIPNRLVESGLNATLEDSYLRVSYPVSLADTTRVIFIVSNDPGSAASDRFHLSFTAAQGPLPVTLISSNAFRQSNSIVVKWTMENESAMAFYELQRSNNGEIFKQIATVKAANLATQSDYSVTDDQPVNRDNYYRIKCIGERGEVTYSKIMKVFMGELAGDIRVYPNPVVHGNVHLKLFNQLPGDYCFRLIDNSGAIMISKHLSHSGGSGSIVLETNKTLPHGVYILIISKPDSSTQKLKVIF